MRREFECRRHTRVIVGRALKIIVGMNLQIDFFFRFTRQRCNRVFDRHVGQRRNIQLQRERDLFSRAEAITQGKALVLAHRDVRDFRQRILGLKHAIARHRDDVNHHRRAQPLRARVGVEQPRTIGCRMTASARHEGAVNDDRLAVDIADDEIGLGAGAQPQDFGGQALRRCARRAGNRKRSLQIDLRAISRTVTGAPVLRSPILRQRVRKPLDRHAEALEFISHVFDALAIGRGSGETSPHLPVHRVAMFE